MELKEYFTVGVVIAITLISVSIYVGNMNITNPTITEFVSKSSSLESQAKNMTANAEDVTTQDKLSQMIESIPILGNIVKTGKYLISMVSVLRSGVDVLIAFFRDVLTSPVLGIDSRIVTLIGALIFVGFAFAVYDAMKN